MYTLHGKTEKKIFAVIFIFERKERKKEKWEEK